MLEGNQSFTPASLFWIVIGGVSMSRAERITAIAAVCWSSAVTHIPALGRQSPGRGTDVAGHGNLMLAIEAEFDIEIPQSAMTPENFDTIAAIDALVSVTAEGGLTDAAGSPCPPFSGDAGRGGCKAVAVMKRRRAPSRPEQPGRSGRSARHRAGRRHA